jgi:hypothetical protein
MRTCPREGIAWLVANDKYNTITALRTTCKTKGCPICRHKVKSKFTMLVEYGCLTLGDSYFTTLTLIAGSDLQKNAAYVRQVWREMLEWLRRSFQTVQFVKVVELTRKYQPHLHLILHLGPTSLTAACELNHPFNDRWRNKQCDCLEHRLSAAWSRITRDSYVVNISKIVNPSRTAGYIGKYMAKTIHHRRQLAALGFKRAWSRSRGWPFDQIRLAQTEQGGWAKKYFTGPNEVPEGFIGHGTSQWWVDTTEARGIPKLGTNLAMALQDRRVDKAARIVPAEIKRNIIW